MVSYIEVLDARACEIHQRSIGEHDVELHKVNAGL